MQRFALELSGFRVTPLRCVKCGFVIRPGRGSPLGRFDARELVDHLRRIGQAQHRVVLQRGSIVAMPHDSLCDLRGNARTGQVGPQFRPHRVKIDHPPFVVLGRDSRLGVFVVALPNQDRITVGIGYSFFARRPRSERIRIPSGPDWLWLRVTFDGVVWLRFSVGIVPYNTLIDQCLHQDHHACPRFKATIVPVLAKVVSRFAFAAALSPNPKMVERCSHYLAHVDIPK